MCLSCLAQSLRLRVITPYLHCHNLPGTKMVRDMSFWREIRFTHRRDGEPRIRGSDRSLTRDALSRSKLLVSVGALASLEQGLYHRRVIDQLRLFRFETIARARILGIAFEIRGEPSKVGCTAQLVSILLQSQEFIFSTDCVCPFCALLVC
jgi:hypothetical protein